MTYVIHEFASATPVFATNSRFAARRMMALFPDAIVTGVRAARVEGRVLFHHGRRRFAHAPLPPDAVGDMWLSRQRQAHALVELPPFSIDLEGVTNEPTQTKSTAGDR